MPRLEPQAKDGFAEKAETWRLRASQTADPVEREKYLYLADQYLRLAQLTAGDPYGCREIPPGVPSKDAG